MDKILEWSAEKRKELFELTASELGMHVAVAEKDFWGCWILGKLFEAKDLHEKILFKGGTSLSKVFRIIDRFSEDIDLVLDWSDFIPEDADIARSKTKQNKFNQETNEAAQNYLKNTLLPMLKTLMGDYCQPSIDESKPLNINVRYTASFEVHYVNPEILLETGPLAAWEPQAIYRIRSYAAEAFPEKFENPEIEVRAIEAKRTFWEKATILHVVAHQPEDKAVPIRYSRHYYDMMSLANSAVKQQAFEDIELLKRVVAFKSKFYHQAWAKYDLAVPGSFKLSPTKRVEEILKKDYGEMQIMIFGETPSFGDIMDSIKNLETEINQL